MTNDVTFYDEIEAYCSTLSVPAGGRIGVHVSAKQPYFDVRVERWGAERIEVFSADRIAGTFFKPPPNADANGCDWPVSFEIDIDPQWRTGFYLVTLTAAGAAVGRNVGHAGFVVHAPSGQRQAALLVLGTNTWNAYNTWGGASLYTGGHQVSFQRPWPRGLLDRPRVDRDDRKARPVRFGEEPDADGEIFQAYRMEHGYSPAIGSTGWFTHERRFVEWAETAGYEFDYAVSSDFDATSDLLAGYDVVLGIGHDEYWTKAGRDQVDRHIAGGGDYVSLSGNTMFWQVRLVDDAGDPALDHMIGHKYGGHTADPVVGTEAVDEMSGLWCDPLVGRPEWTTLGAGSVFGLYHRFGQATPRGTGGFTVFRYDHWMFEGTGLRYGDLLGGDHGVVGYETIGCPITLDEYQLPVVRPVAGMPTDHEIVGLSLSSNLGMGEYPKSISALNDQGDLEFLAERYYGDTSPENLARVRHGNAVMVVCRPQGTSGGEVVTVGSTDWVFGLADDRLVSQVTANIMNRFFSGPGAVDG
ncbi:MAG: N,N-dimethylformamidase beta subunit family domain-containing protein [Acidimicrobiales bacterium]|jgi:hypothetical protein